MFGLINSMTLLLYLSNAETIKIFHELYHFINCKFYSLKVTQCESIYPKGRQWSCFLTQNLLRVIYSIEKFSKTRTSLIIPLTEVPLFNIPPTLLHHVYHNMIFDRIFGKGNSSLPACVYPNIIIIQRSKRNLTIKQMAHRRGQIAARSIIKIYQLVSTGKYIFAFFSMTQFF